MNGFERIDTTANRLKKAIDDSGKRQADIARETGIDKGSISHYLKGRYEPKADAINKMAISLNVSEMWLMGYDCPMKRQIEEKPQEKTEASGGERTLGDILKALRLQNKLTLAECSGELGITVKDLQLIENGNKQISPNTMNSFAKLFGMRSVDLVGLYFFPNDNADSFTFSKEYINSVKRWYREFGEQGLTPDEQTKLFEYTKFLVWQRKN